MRLEKRDKYLAASMLGKNLGGKNLRAALGSSTHWSGERDEIDTADDFIATRRHSREAGQRALLVAQIAVQSEPLEWQVKWALASRRP
jgi:hypothetical protein